MKTLFYRFRYCSFRWIVCLLLVAGLATAIAQETGADSTAAQSRSVEPTPQPQQSVPEKNTPQPEKQTNTDSLAAAADSVQKSAIDSAANDSATVASDTSSGDPTGIVDAIKKTQPDPQFSLSFGKIFWSIIILLIALYIIRWFTRLLEAIAERWPNLRLTIKRLIPSIRIISWIIVIYEIIVVVLAPPIETIIAFSASAGIAIGFASQDILKNIFGGLMILFDRPFQVGDKVEAAGHYGEVMQIGLRTVRIVTPDDNLVSVPNGEIMNQAVSNANAGESNCQVVAEFFLPPQIDLERTREIAYLAAATSRYVFLNKPIVVIFKNEIHEGRSLLKMRLKAYVLDIRYEFPFMSDMTETVLRELLAKELVRPEQLNFITSDPHHT
ncbi:MAG: mechanosensitive ion channel [Calditrichaeota bacterium]|nr:mechanosensitive ion channel [Calditrichota bacterium]MCB0268728.1 mechanosensitive ion channel [Calditrichota bacterium]MCB0301096.1 mechanosensitive ion channel [Calditrichota bacterium]